MTAHTPATKASSASPLLASISTEPQAQPPQQQVTGKQDFLSVILNAVSGHPAGTRQATGTNKTDETNKAVKDAPSTDSAQSADQANADKNKLPSTPAATSPDATAASLLLALLAQPLPTLHPLPVRKASGGSSSAHAAQEAQPAGSGPNKVETKAEKAVVVDKPLKEMVEPSLLKAVESKASASSGTSAANTNHVMRQSAERNEIAAKTEQKLPPAVISAVSSADTGGPSSDGGAKSSLPFTWHEAPVEPVSILDFSGPMANGVSPMVETKAEALTAAASKISSVDRLERLISHEVMTIRQSGAESLGVSLKLDSNTHLYLQLTSNNGSIQASVRCERGSFSPEDGQWAQLQASLAKQNVTLQPMTGSSNLSFQQSSDRRPRPQNAEREEWPKGGNAVQPAQPRKQKEQSRSRKSWESWA